MTEAVVPNLAAHPSISTLVVTAPRAPHDSAFHTLLSELNPLQYIPVVGAIYRALTGDRIPEEARALGSLVMSGITGGPAGVAISVAAMAAEKATGIDPEKLGQKLLADIGIGAEKPVASQAPPHPPAATPPNPGRASRPPKPAWSSAQLAAYGVTTTQGGFLRQGALLGSDVLNSLELARLAAASRAAGRSEPFVAS